MTVVFDYSLDKEYDDISLDSLIDNIINMLNIQDELNKKIDMYWKQNRTIYDFELAAKLEIAEFIESMPWKWWKKGNVDINNCKIELVDVWHFLLSLELLKIDAYGFDEDRCRALLKDIFQYESFKLPIISSYTTLGLDLLNINFSDHSVCYSMMWIVYPSGYVFDTISEFIKLYYLKVGLNSFRQSEGYKTGEYKKYLEGKEDNEFLFELISDFEIPDKNITLQELEDKVRNIIVR